MSFQDDSEETQKINPPTQDTAVKESLPPKPQIKKDLGAKAKIKKIYPSLRKFSKNQHPTEDSLSDTDWEDLEEEAAKYLEEDLPPLTKHWSPP